jgi:ketosteroid isomerase-like protein
MVLFLKNFFYTEMPKRIVNRGATGLLLLPLLIAVQLWSSAAAQKKQDMTMAGVDQVTTTADEAAIRAVHDKFTAAFDAGDIDAMMKNYIADKSLFVFDVVPRKEYLGADAYRNDWVDFFKHFKGTPKLVITALGITVDGNIGFSHSFQRVTGTDDQGHPVDRTVRVTDGYRKIGGKWLIVLEHISLPVNLKTGMAAPTQ